MTMYVLKTLATKCFIPNIVCRNIKYYKKKLPPDPGVSLRKNILETDQENAEFEDFDDFESDFMGLHHTHKDHLRESRAQKEREKYLIIKQKYFKQKLPNFLTWHDKEQIRYLYRTNPEEWSIERLSEGFPALPDVIKKITESNWTMDKQTRIDKHDAAVKSNWELFKKGELTDLPTNVKEHLNKFTDRSLVFKRFELNTTEEKLSEVSRQGEFYKIIKSYQEMKWPEPKEKVEDSKPQCLEIEETSKNPGRRQKSLTLDQLKENLNKRAERGSSINEIEASIVKKSNTEEADHHSSSADDIKTLVQYKASTGVLYRSKSEKDLAHLIFPEKITIPKKIYKKGSTYKLNDCYYDDDGEFLYRVPGMH